MKGVVNGENSRKEEKKSQKIVSMSQSRKRDRWIDDSRKNVLSAKHTHTKTKKQQKILLLLLLA